MFTSSQALESLNHYWQVSQLLGWFFLHKTIPVRLAGCALKPTLFSTHPWINTHIYGLLHIFLWKQSAWLMSLVSSDQPSLDAGLIAPLHQLILLLTWSLPDPRGGRRIDALCRRHYRQTVSLYIFLFRCFLPLSAVVWRKARVVIYSSLTASISWPTKLTPIRSFKIRSVSSSRWHLLGGGNPKQVPLANRINQQRAQESSPTDARWRDEEILTRCIFCPHSGLVPFVPSCVW